VIPADPGLASHAIVSATSTGSPPWRRLLRRLEDQQPGRIRERLQHPGEPRGTVSIQGATDRLRGIKIEAQQVAGRRHDHSNVGWSNCARC
jgi:hypothetical protein